MQFKNVQSCKELTEWHFAEACLTPHTIGLLCEKLEGICRPNDGEEKVLEFLGRLALLSHASRICPNQNLSLVIKKESPPDVIPCLGAFLILRNQKGEEIFCLHLHLDWKAFKNAALQSHAYPFQIFMMNQSTLILKAPLQDRKKPGPKLFQKMTEMLWMRIRSSIARKEQQRIQKQMERQIEKSGVRIKKQNRFMEMTDAS